VTGPLALGYMSVPADTGAGVGEAGVPEEAARAAVHVLRRFAAREGYTLGGVFTDVRDRSQSGLHALLDAVRRDEAAAVVVPDLGHLRHVGCLAGADARTASHFLRARLVTMAPDRLLTSAPTGGDAEGLSGAPADTQQRGRTAVSGAPMGQPAACTSGWGGNR
jgi:hypothetical protein